MKKLALLLVFLAVCLFGRFLPVTAQSSDRVCPEGDSKYEWNGEIWRLVYGSDYGVSGDAQTVTWTPFVGTVCLKKSTDLVSVDGMVGSATTPDHDWSHLVLTLSLVTPTPTPTTDPTVTPTATATADPTATPTPDPTATPSSDPTVTPTATATADPTATATSESGTGGTSTTSSSNSSSGSSSSTTPQVLGASTLAKTGPFEDALMNLVFTAGSVLSALGIRKRSSR